MAMGPVPFSDTIALKLRGLSLTKKFWRLLQDTPAPPPQTFAPGVGCTWAGGGGGCCHGPVIALTPRPEGVVLPAGMAVYDAAGGASVAHAVLLQRKAPMTLSLMTYF